MGIIFVEGLRVFLGAKQTKWRGDLVKWRRGSTVLLPTKREVKDKEGADILIQLVALLLFFARLHQVVSPTTPFPPTPPPTFIQFCSSCNTFSTSNPRYAENAHPIPDMPTNSEHSSYILLFNASQPALLDIYVYINRPRHHPHPHLQVYIIYMAVIILCSLVRFWHLTCYMLTF